MHTVKQFKKDSSETSRSLKLYNSQDLLQRTAKVAKSAEIEDALVLGFTSADGETMVMLKG